MEGNSTNLQGQNKSHCGDLKMVHTTLVPQPLDESDEKHGHNRICKKFGITPGSRKYLSTTSKASPTRAPDCLKELRNHKKKIFWCPPQKQAKYNQHFKLLFFKLNLQFCAWNLIFRCRKLNLLLINSIYLVVSFL